MNIGMEREGVSNNNKIIYSKTKFSMGWQFFIQMKRCWRITKSHDKLKRSQDCFKGRMGRGSQGAAQEGKGVHNFARST
jgi:hypothetical protein